MAVYTVYDEVAQDFVDNKFNESTQYAKEAWESALSFVSDLAEAGVINVPDASISLNAPEDPIKEITAEPPSMPSLDLDMPSDPSVPLITAVEIGDVEIPLYDISVPDISWPSIPSITWPESPGDPPSMGEVSVPNAPSLTLPEPPTISDVTLPDPPSVDLPTFEGEKPTDDLTPPGELFVYNEDQYSSQLKDEVYNKLVSDIQNGGTGLGEEAEEAIWQRGRDRLDVELERSFEEIDKGWAARGFMFPPGALLAARQRATEDINARKTDLNSDITVKQAELAWQQTQEIVKNGLAMEQMLINYTNAVADRAFQVARATAEFGLALYDAKVKKFQAKLEQYRVDAEVFRAKLEAALADLQVYRDKLQGAQIEADIQQRYVDLYNAQLGAVQTLVGIYQTEVQAAQTKADVEKTKLSAFGEQVRAYATEVEAKTSQYNAYNLQNQGLLAQVQAYSEKVGAYRTRVDAARAEAETKAQQANVEIENNRLKVEQYKADLDGFRAKVQAIASAIDAQVRGYQAQTGVYDAQVRGQTAEIGAEMDTYKAKVDMLETEARVAIQNASVNLERTKSAASLNMEAIKAGANVSAQLAASALASVNTSASYGFTGRGGATYSENHTYSYSEE